MLDPRRTIYRSPQGREALATLCARRRERLDGPVESIRVSTRLGPTHVLLAGPADGAPLVLFHGAASSAVDLAETFPWLAPGHRRLFVDIPGEPGLSSEERPRKTGATIGLWVGEILNELGLDRVGVFGVSLGAFVALRAATVIPDRMERMALLVPEGLARPRYLPLMRALTLPAVRYCLSPSDTNAHRFVESLAGSGALVPPGFLEQMAHYMRHVKLPPGPGPLLTRSELAGLSAPVLVIAGAEDVLFPGDRVARRARAVIPNLEQALVVPGAGHVYFPTPQSTVARLLNAFLAGATRPT